jgi:pyruvate dehydrogenase E2 component (dihydrolipoamide acetyltransferase)
MREFFESCRTLLNQASRKSTAAVTLTTTADMTKLLQTRQRFKSTTDTEHAIPTITDFIVKVTADVLRAHPLLNSRWADDSVVMESEIHIGIAVDVETGLRVPVLRNADQITLLSIAEQSRVLIAKARTEQLTAQEMQGGTFTITNLGSYGIEAFTPIIQLPQCAILGIGRIKKVPVFIEGQFQPRDTATLSLTFDHRIVDGAPAARFLQSLVRAIENLDL